MKRDRDIFIRLLGYIRPYRTNLLMALVSGVVIAGFTPGLTYAIKFLFDALEAKHWDKIHTVFLMICGLFFGDLVFRFVRNYSLRSVAEKCVAQLRFEVAQKLVGMSVTYFEKQAAGQLTSRVMYDSATLPAAMEGLGYYITSPLTLLILVIVALTKDWKLTLFVFVAVPVITLIFKIIGSSVQRNAQRTNERMGEINVWLSELAHGIRSIKVFGSEPILLRSFAEKNKKALTSTLKMIYVQELASPLNEFVMAVVAGLALLFGSMRVLRGELTTGELLQVVAALGFLQEPVRRMNGVHLRLMQGLAGARRLFELLDAPVEIEVPSNEADAVKKIAKPDDSVELQFDDVTFGYGSESVQKALSHVSFKLKPREWLGIRGRSGAGKSTLAHLIPGLYPGYSGKILLNGREVRDLPLEYLRAHVSFVSQDIFLFNDTIFNNIRFGKPGATLEDVEKAARDAFAHDFILKLPAGYETIVGDRGCKLSGGQRQRISIARAFLKGAPLVILDEATSALDQATEDEVHDALEKLMKNHTVLIIAHRETMLARAHRVIDLQDGSVVT